MINWMGVEPGAAVDRVVSVGGFDGVHTGHLHVIDRMTAIARDRGLEVLVASFDPHPRSVLFGEQERRLTTIDERRRLLRKAGVDRFVTLAFSEEMARMEPAYFVEEILLGQLGAKVIVVGHDHRFGRKRAGDATLLRALGDRLGFDVVEMDAHVSGGEAISSSRIRTHVVDGQVAEAARLLGRSHGLSGTVVKGAGRGRTIGIPTANLDPVDPLKLVPGKGVYAVWTKIPGEEERLPGMMNIGNRPTFEGEGLHLEVNILDWTGDLYGREVRVEFVRRIRNERKFDGPDALIRQLNEDRERCRALLQEVS